MAGAGRDFEYSGVGCGADGFDEFLQMKGIFDYRRLRVGGRLAGEFFADFIFVFHDVIDSDPPLSRFPRANQAWSLKGELCAFHSVAGVVEIADLHDLSVFPFEQDEIDWLR